MCDVRTVDEIRQAMDNLDIEIATYRDLHTEAVTKSKNGELPRYRGDWHNSMKRSEAKRQALEWVLCEREVV